VLVDDGFAVWDSLAIAEYLAEKFPEKHLWPKDAKARARARSICAEMHSGFTALRTHCSMNIEARLPEVGAIIWRDQPGVREDVKRLVAMWTELLDEHQGPMLFGEFSAADAFYAPVFMRLVTYVLPVPGHITDYIRRFCALPGPKAWIDAALTEKEFLERAEPYRISRSPTLRA
jgi:glutathione S-transferase